MKTKKGLGVILEAEADGIGIAVTYDARANFGKLTVLSRWGGEAVNREKLEGAGLRPQDCDVILAALKTYTGRVTVELAPDDSSTEHDQSGLIVTASTMPTAAEAERYAGHDLVAALIVEGMNRR